MPLVIDTLAARKDEVRISSTARSAPSEKVAVRRICDSEQGEVLPLALLTTPLGLAWMVIASLSTRAAFNPGVMVIVPGPATPDTGT